MGKPEDEKKENSPSVDRDRSLETRQIRGLSQRLRRPLSLESNLPPDAAMPVPPHAAEGEAPATRLIGNAAAPETALPAAPSVPAAPAVAAPETRQIRREPEKPIPTEGLLMEGTLLQGRYKILGVIGVGGMGAVYKAQDLRFANVMRLCAVKEMINTSTDPQVRQMIVRNFEREASILATLSHPAIPQVYDFFTEGVRSYLVLEFVSGKDLEALLAETEGFFSETTVVDWAVQLCDVLSYLHNNKPKPIVFRDLKPSNIMLDDHGRIRLVDFGIAKLFQSGEKGTMIGTEGYSPPEQYRGIAEPRCDIYALGATLHHLLSKQDPRLEPPFSFHERPIHKTNPTVSRELIEVINRCLEYDINKRWNTAEELKRALLALNSARGLSSAAPAPRTGETAAFVESTIKPLWRFACEDEVRAGLALFEGLVFVPSYDNNLYAIDAENGEFVWKYPTEGGLGSTPCVAEGLVVFGSTDGVVYAVNARSGRLAWSMPTKGKIYSSPQVAYGHVFIGSDDHNLYAIHLGSGRKVWNYATDGQVRTRPYIEENLIVFADTEGNCYALGLNRENKWRFRARRAFLSSPVMHKGLVLLGSMDWNFYALDNRSGWVVWRYRTGGPVVSSPIIFQRTVFFGSTDGAFYALDVNEGRVVWRYECEAKVTCTPAIYGDRVYFGDIDGHLYCLDAQSGGLRWRYKLDGAITGTLLVDDGVLYLGATDNAVYAFPA